MCSICCFHALELLCLIWPFTPDFSTMTRMLFPWYPTLHCAPNVCILRSRAVELPSSFSSCVLLAFLLWWTFRSSHFSFGTSLPWFSWSELRVFAHLQVVWEETSPSLYSSLWRVNSMTLLHYIPNVLLGLVIPAISVMTRRVVNCTIAKLPFS